MPFSLLLFQMQRLAPLRIEEYCIFIQNTFNFLPVRSVYLKTGQPVTSLPGKFTYANVRINVEKP